MPEWIVPYTNTATMCMHTYVLIYSRKLIFGIYMNIDTCVYT